MHFLPSQHVLKLHFDWDKTYFHWKGLHATGLWKAEVQPHHSNKGATSAWIWLVLIFLLCNKDLCFELNLSWLQNKIELNIHIFLTSKETLGYFVNSSCHLPHKHFCRGEDFSFVFQVLQTPPAILFQIKTEMLCIFHPFTKQSATEPYTSDICTNSLWLSHKTSVGGAVQSQGKEHMEQTLGDCWQ